MWGLPNNMADKLPAAFQETKSMVLYMHRLGRLFQYLIYQENFN